MIAVEEWERRGTYVTTPDGRIFATQHDAGTRSAEDVLVLHGFPASSWDFATVIERLAPSRRVVAFDFLGYGLSDKPRDHGYSLFEQADVAIAVARHFGVRRAHLVAHDMGTSVTTELLARRERGLLPFEVASVTLSNGSVHVDLAHLTVGQRLLRSPVGPLFARLNNRATFTQQVRRTFGIAPSDAEIAAMWSLIERNGGKARMAPLSVYIAERTRFARRWIGALERLDVPALIAWGERDPIAVMDIARALAAEIPNARLETWNDVGHWPQLEVPERLASALERFWS